MYKELASLIDDNDFLTEHDKDSKKYLIVVEPDNEYMEEIIDERTNSKEAQIVETVTYLASEIDKLKQMMTTQTDQ